MTKIPNSRLSELKDKILKSHDLKKEIDDFLSEFIKDEEEPEEPEEVDVAEEIKKREDVLVFVLREITKTAPDAKIRDKITRFIELIETYSFKDPFDFISKL